MMERVDQERPGWDGDQPYKRTFFPAHIRVPKEQPQGRANTARGAAHFLRETVNRVRYAGASEQLPMRADSAPACAI